RTLLPFPAGPKGGPARFSQKAPSPKTQEENGSPAIERGLKNEKAPGPPAGEALSLPVRTPLSMGCSIPPGGAFVKRFCRMDFKILQNSGRFPKSSPGFPGAVCALGRNPPRPLDKRARPAYNG